MRAVDESVGVEDQVIVDPSAADLAKSDVDTGTPGIEARSDDVLDVGTGTETRCINEVVQGTDAPVMVVDVDAGS